MKQNAAGLQYEAGGDNTYTFPDTTGTIPLGTGASGRVSYWNGTNTLTSDSAFTYASGALTLGNGAEQGKISLYNNSGTGTSSIQPDGSTTSTLTFTLPDVSGNLLASSGGASGQMPVWSGSSFLSSNPDFLFSNGKITLGVGAGGSTGGILLKGATSGTVTITLSGATAGTGTWTLPGVTDTFVGRATTDTLTNKRITKRVLALSAGSATPSINTDNYDVVHITAQSAAITSFTTNLTGTPVDGDTLRISITDDGTGRAITWGSSFEASTVALPTTTVASARLDVGFFWNTATSKWRCVASC